MGTEIFPTIPLRAADVIDRAMSGFAWSDPPNGSRKDVRVLHLIDTGSVMVYIGNGPYVNDRGYRADAVWFEAFGLGGPRRYTGPFFAALGRELGCEFITELGQRVTEEDGVDSDDWGEGEQGWHPVAIAAMERSPGSTGGLRIFDKPKE